jgi:hypothetical protein
MGGTIDLDDLGCRDNKGLIAKAGAGGTYNDLMMKVFPHILILSNPALGILYTSSESLIHSCLSRLGQDQHLQWSSILSTLAVLTTLNKRHAECSLMIAQPFCTSPEECAEYMFHDLTRPDHKTGAYFLSSNGEDAVKNKYLEQPDIRQKVWDHAIEVTGLNTK